MTKTERHLIREAANTAIYLFIKGAKSVGIDKTVDTIDPTDWFYMQMLVNSAIDDNSKRQTNFLEGLNEKRRQEFHENIAIAANGGIQSIKRCPDLYGL